MKILFYLPVVTPWWFGEIIAPMLRALHGVADLHVMVAPLWRNTGIEGAQLDAIADLDRINWHVVEADDPALFRTEAARIPGLLDRIAQIAPDITLARSADLATPGQFPGQLRYIMEGAAAPFDTDPRWVVLEEKPFAHGAMPADAAAIGDLYANALDDLWRDAERRLAREPLAGWRDHFGLPRNRPIVAVPLQYEHEENFFLAASAFPRGVDMIAHLLDRLAPDVFLAITDHPLNRIHVDRSAIAALIDRHSERAVLCAADKMPYGATGLLAARTDAVLIDQSKSWSLAAFAGTPIMRIGNSGMASWLNAAEPAAGAVTGRTPPEKAAARRWFGWHLGARIVDPAALTLDRLLAHLADTPDDAGIAANLSRLQNARKVAA